MSGGDATPPNGNDRKAKWTAFRKRHPMPYTVVFDPQLEATIRDEEATAFERVRALSWITAWGHNDLLDACTDENGVLLTQADFGRILKLSTTTVQRVVSELEARGLLRRKGKAMYPVDDPGAELAGFVPHSRDLKRSKGEDYQEFLTFWRVECAEDAKRLRNFAASLLGSISPKWSVLRSGESPGLPGFLPMNVPHARVTTSRTPRKLRPRLPQQTARLSLLVL